MSTIHFIGGEKGGVGKSVVARLVTQYCIDKSLPFAAVDADVSHRSLLRYYADFARPVDLAHVESADEIIALATDVDQRVVVDLPAQSDLPLSRWIAEAGVLALARECHVRVVFWHVTDGGKDSNVSLERLLARYGDDASYVVVKNAARGADFALFDASSAKLRAEALGAHLLELPELNAPAMQKIDRLDASFWAAGNNATFGGDAFTRMDRQRIRVWLNAAFDELAKAV